MKTIKNILLLIATLLLTAVSAWAEVAVRAWVQRYGFAAGGANDEARKVVTDSDGNVIVAGNTGTDFLIIKYSSSGVGLWTNVYGGWGDDWLTGLAVHGSGNVYVTGRFDNGANYDFATVAYSGAGVALWTNRYNGPGNYNDIATAIAVDGGGHVYVTGGSGDDGYLTIAYSGAGVALWTNRYNVPGSHYSDIATAIAVDGSGHVYVTGSSDDYYGPFIQYANDYATIAYTSAGVPLWTNRYNGPVDGSDAATAIVVDGTGNVYVTGYSDGGGDSGESGFDFATVAYTSAGVALWINRYTGPETGGDFPTGIVVDGSGNVYVAGTSEGNYATVAYSSAGVALWTNYYNGQVAAVAGDGSGNVYVTGFSDSSGPIGTYDYATIAYNGAGVGLWTNRYGGPTNDFANALAVGGGGNVYVTGRSDNRVNNDFATVAYNSTGVALWTNRCDGLGRSYDQANAVAVDKSGNGNVYMTGYSYNGTNDDYATVAYNSEGVALWTNRYDGPVNSDDSAIAIAVDGSGNVIVTGGSSFNGAPIDYATIAYTSAGVALWTNRHGGGSATAMALGGNGNVYVSGSSDKYDYVTIAYSSTGLALWTNGYYGLGVGGWPTAMAVNGNGNVFVTGVSHSGDNLDYATIAYSSTGVALWTNRYAGSGNDSDRANAIAVGGNGNVYVTGGAYNMYDSDVFLDYVTIAYNSGGMAVWTNQYHGDNFSVATGLAVDGSGNVYVTGDSGDNVTLAYSSAGTALWTNYCNGGGVNAIALDGSGNVYVTGGGYTTVAYTGAGVALWTNRYEGESNEATAITADGNGNVYVAGVSFGGTPFASPDYTLVKYAAPSAPRLSITPDGGPGFFVRYTGVPAVTYRLQRAPSVTGPWSNVATSTAPPSGFVEYHETVPLPGQAFYRTVQP